MATAKDFPPLFTLGGPVGWMFALGSYIFGLGKNQAAARRKLFEGHAARNAARGWHRGANQAAQETEPVYDPDTGIKTGKVLRDIWAASRKLDALPGIHSGRTMDRAARDASRANPAARPQMSKALRELETQNAKVKAQTKASAARTAQQTKSNDSYWKRARAGGISGPLAGGVVAGAVEPSVALLSEVLYRKSELELERSDARQRLSTLSNRRGALASRGFQPTGSTNRTGAGASRPFIPESELPRANSGSATAASGSKSAESEHAGSRAVAGESAASKEAKRVLAASRSLPTAQGAVSGAQSGLASLARVGLASVLTSAFGSSPSTRLSSASSTRLSSASSSRLSSATPASSGLTPFNALGVQSASSERCKCPKPPSKKTRKDGKPRCVNPVISRTTRDGIRTTKVELKCQPSKPKSPLL